ARRIKTQQRARREHFGAVQGAAQGAGGSQSDRKQRRSRLGDIADASMSAHPSPSQASTIRYSTPLYRGGSFVPIVDGARTILRKLTNVSIAPPPPRKNLPPPGRGPMAAGLPPPPRRHAGKIRRPGRRNRVRDLATANSAAGIAASTVHDFHDD